MSGRLLKGGAPTWAEFARRYRVFDSRVGFDRANKGIKNHGQKFTLRLLQQLGRRGNVTLMCHCDEDEKHCHRHLLAKVLAGKVGVSVRTMEKAGRKQLLRFPLTAQ
jgi:uncharacterized protein YeaO (DUF488 family)